MVAAVENRVGLGAQHRRLAMPKQFAGAQKLTRRQFGAIRSGAA